MSRKTAYASVGSSLALIQRAGANGVLRDAPLRSVGARVETSVATTTDFMIRDPVLADDFCKFGFEAVRRALS